MTPGRDRRRRRHGAFGCERAALGLGRAGGEHGEAVELRLGPKPQQRDRRLRLRQHRLGLIALQPRRVARVEQERGQLQHPLVVTDAPLGEGQAGLEAAQLQVGVGRLGGDHQPGSRQAEVGGLCVGAGGFAAAPQAAEEVYLPTGADRLRRTGRRRAEKAAAWALEPTSD